MKKALVFVSGLTLSLFLLAACGAGNTSRSTETNIETPTPMPMSETSIQQTRPVDETKRAGKEGYGFVSVPNDWVAFIDPNAAPDAIQFSDAAGKNIITLTAAYNPEADPEDVLNAYANSMEEGGAEGITGASVSLNGISALQIYGFYVEEDICLVAWAFQTDDGYMHLISAEGLMDRVMDVVGYLESTYALDA